MDNCKFCGAEIEENASVCPNCGKELLCEETVEAVCPDTTENTLELEEKAEIVQNDQAAEETNEKKLSSGKLAAIVTAVVVVTAILIAIVVGGMKEKNAEVVETIPETQGTEIPSAEVPAAEATVPADGNPEDVTCRGTYTAADEDILAAKDKVVATAGDTELTVGQLQLYYWMQVREFLSQYSSYLQYFSLDYTQGLDVQLCALEEKTMTWQQYFLQGALEAWQTYASMAAEAEKAGFKMPAEYQEMLDGMAADLDESAVASGFENGTEVLHKSLGNTVEMEDYLRFMEIYYRGYSYFMNQSESIKEPTDAEVKAFFEEHAEGYAESGITKDSKYVDVRHVLITPEVAEGESEATEEAWAAAEKRAQELLDEWRAGKADEDAFAEMANTYSTDPGSNTNGGLYTGVYEGQMLQAFNDWCFDASRQYGDYGIVETNYGYHIMFYVGGTPIWQDYVRSDMKQEQADSVVEGIRSGYPLNVNYEEILLCKVDM